VTPFALALFLYYAYNGHESERAFSAIAAADPANAMAYWGEALAAGPDMNTSMTPERFERGQSAIAKAVAAESGASASDRALIDAMALRYRGTFADWESDDAAYRNAMQQIARRTGDAMARDLTAEALLENRDRDAALALINAQLAVDPNDVMANHLCIHAGDEAVNHATAVPCAQRLDAMTFVPQAEHLAHMPAHAWIETGEYAKAIGSSERAYALFEALKSDTTRDPAHDRLEDHDVYVGYAAAMMLGNYAEAKVWSARTSASFDLPLGAFTALRFGRYQEAYALTETPQFRDAAIRGLAALRLGKLDEARAMRSQLGNATGDSTDLFLARLAESDGRIADAYRALDHLATYQKNAFAGEMIPLWPALAARGGLALRQHDYAKAAAAFRADLAAYPRDPRALFGLAAALAGLGDASGAQTARAAFTEAWAGADTTLSIDDL
jgi:tetratricopeptide (TPR) repeat protein